MQIGNLYALKHWLILAISLVSLLSLSYGQAQNEFLYYNTDFESASTGVGALSGYDGWIATDSLASGLIEEGIIGHGKAAYIGYLINEDKATAAAVRTFHSQYPQSGRPIYSIDLDYVMMESSNGEKDIFMFNITNGSGQILASILFDNLSKAILSRSAATGAYASTGLIFNTGIVGKLEFKLDLAADTWSARIGSIVLIENAALVGLSEVDRIPARLNLVWGLRDAEAPGDNYIIFDNVRISADSGPYVFIQEQPASQGVLPGSTALISVNATGEAQLEYQWYAGRSGETDNPISEATEAVFETPAINESAEYWVRISNQHGHVDSASAIITPRRNPPITVETVEVTSPGNDADNFGPGAVNYNYHIGKYPVTNQEYVAFLNAVAAEDPHELYDPRMGTEIHGGIERSGSSGSYTYSIRTADVGYNAGRSMAPMPVTYVSFWSAARFANWLTSGDTESGVYDFDGVSQPSPSDVARDQTLFLNGGVAIANDNEWYKAAFFDPAFTGYWDYSNMSNVSPGGLPFSSQRALNYDGVVGTVTATGAYGQGSASAFGTFEQSGNIFEWVDDQFTENRRARGGAYDSEYIGYGFPRTELPSESFSNTGFRIASGEPVIRRAVLTLAQSGVGEGEILLAGQAIENLPEAMIFQAGSEISLTAVPNLGATFLGWSGDVSDLEQNISFTLDEDKTITAAFGLLVGPPIIEQPLSRTVTSGATATLTVAAAGDDLSYQWYMGESGDTNVALSNANGATLELEDIQATASYWVRVTNNNGDFTDSATATMTVATLLGLNHWSVASTETSDTLNGVVWGSDRFVAVGNSGTILTSTDGYTWQAQLSHTSSSLQAVASNGSELVAVGYGGTILSSSDGQTWVARASGSTQTLIDVTYGSHGFVAVGGGAPF